MYTSPETGPDKSQDEDKACEGEQHAAEVDAKSGFQGRTGRRKVSPLLGILQWITIRKNVVTQKDPEVMETVQLHVPSQVLPKVRALAR